MRLAGWGTPPLSRRRTGVLRPDRDGEEVASLGSSGRSQLPRAPVTDAPGRDVSTALTVRAGDRALGVHAAAGTFPHGPLCTGRVGPAVFHPAVTRGATRARRSTPVREDPAFTPSRGGGTLYVTGSASHAVTDPSPRLRPLSLIEPICAMRSRSRTVLGVRLCPVASHLKLSWWTSSKHPRPDSDRSGTRVLVFPLTA